MISAAVSKEIIKLGLGLRTVESSRENVTQSCTKLVVLGGGRAVVVVEPINVTQFNQYVQELETAGYLVQRLGDSVLFISIQ